MWKPFAAISIGAALGALQRRAPGSQFNSLFPSLPLGTLAADLVGVHVIGITGEWRLFRVRTAVEFGALGECHD